MREPSYRKWIARSLARAMLADALRAGGTDARALRARAAATLGNNPAWLKPLTDALGRLSRATWQRSDLTTLTRRIEEMPEFGAAFDAGQRPQVHRLILRTATMQPRPLGLAQCALPVLASHEDLAAWLGIDAERLHWFANEAHAWRDNPHPHRIPAAHYRYQLQPKRLGGFRLLEIPKADLKQLQRRILEDLLQRVPVHEAAHGFVRGRSVATHAAAHVGQAVVIGFDLRDFFPSVRASRVHALWRTLGYPEGVVRTLTALCTTRTASAVVERMREEDSALDWLGARRLSAPHLPQGAPTSPALANLCAFRFDLRLEGLAWVFGARFTRYADDLVFSGPAALRGQMPALQAWVAGIAADEGFALHPRKTRCQPQHRQQRVTGVIVNQKLNTPRDAFDQLKAQLHQCTLHGPDAQNREQVTDFRSHLLGRIAWVGQFSATRKTKLIRLFERIEWPAPIQSQ